MATIVSAKGDLLLSGAEALVNTVNVVGVMGKGIALAFKRAYPDNFSAYADACQKGEVAPGKIFVFESATLMGPRLILNLPTKRHWRDPSRIDDVEAGISALADLCREKSIRSIAIPPLGCGNGGLDWRVVRPKIVRALKNLPDLEVRLHDPPGFFPDQGPGQQSRKPSGRASFSPPF